MAAFHLIGRTLPIHFALLGRKRKYVKSKTTAKLINDRCGPRQIGTVWHIPDSPTFSLPTTFNARSKLPASLISWELTIHDKIYWYCVQNPRTDPARKYGYISAGNPRAANSELVSLHLTRNEIGPKWHLLRSLPFQGPTLSHLPSWWICSYQKNSVRGCINNRSINSCVARIVLDFMGLYFVAQYWNVSRTFSLTFFIYLLHCIDRTTLKNFLISYLMNFTVTFCVTYEPYCHVVLTK